LVSTGVAFATLSPDANCGIQTDGNAYCWSQAFDAASASFARPAPIANGFNFSAITPTHHHRCGILRTSGTVLCWGANDVGQLGNGGQSYTGVPSPVVSP
jgi:hypothetical protein